MEEISKGCSASLSFSPLLLDPLIFLRECGEQHRHNGGHPFLSFRRPSAVSLHPTVIVVRDMGEISKRLFGFSLSFFPTYFRSTAFSSRMRGTASQERWVDGRAAVCAHFSDAYFKSISQWTMLFQCWENLRAIFLPPKSPPFLFAALVLFLLHLTVIVVRDMGEISKRRFGFSLFSPTSFRFTAFSSRMRGTASQEQWVDDRYTKAMPYIYFDHLLFFMGPLSVLIFQTPVSNSAASKRNHIFQSSSGKRRWLWEKEILVCHLLMKKIFVHPNTRYFS
ncbi:hypothetical protein CEXT_293801 [Caerostris extrusa]|uniref:Uncharacterized protein n=1 Tax=Caerostris extrusa TaxID=172846 RepID=A0AAV4VCN8_CAEEX|nr:hypothetical protein CEXT_293801 [Caerostris extrusa]